MKNETISVDDIECPWCGKKFDGENATNYDTSCNYVKCPECGKGICVMQSIEYTCYRQADQDLEDRNHEEKAEEALPCEWENNFMAWAYGSVSEERL